MLQDTHDWSAYLDPTLLSLGGAGSPLPSSLTSTGHCGDTLAFNEPTMFPLASQGQSPPSAGTAPSPTPSLSSSYGGQGTGDESDFSPLSPVLSLFTHTAFPFPTPVDTKLAPVPTPTSAPLLFPATPSAVTESEPLRRDAQQAEALSLASWVIAEHTKLEQTRQYQGGKASTPKSATRAAPSSVIAPSAKGGAVQQDKKEERLGWLQRLREAEEKAGALSSPLLR